MQNQQTTPNGVTEIRATTKEIDALMQCLEVASKDYANKGSKNKRGAIFVQVLLIVLSALTTIFIGWKATGDAPNLFLINLGLVCSAVVAGLNVINAFFDYRELWAQYKVSRNQLRILLSELNYIRASGDENVTKSQLGEIFAEYKNICEQTNKTYQQLRMAKDSTEK